MGFYSSFTIHSLNFVPNNIYGIIIVGAFYEKTNKEITIL